MTNTENAQVSVLMCRCCGFVTTDVWLVATCPREHGDLTDITKTLARVREIAWLS